MKDQTRELGNVQLGVEQPAEPKLSVVKFHSTKIQCCIDPDGTINVALKPICDAIGIHADKAYDSIKKDTILGAKATVRSVLDAKKRKFPMQTLPIEYVHGWLFSIDASKVSANAKPKLLQFKKECYQVLFDHFYGKYKVYESNLSQRRMMMAEMSTLIADRELCNTRIRQIKKRLAEIEQQEITGQLLLIK